MQKDDLEQAIFGASDGLTSTVAIVIASLIAGSRHSLIAGGFAIAIAAGVGMGWSEWLGDAESSNRRALVMMLATLVASAAPVVPFLLLWKTSGVIACAAVAVVILVGVTIMRGSLTKQSHARAWLVTIGGTVIVGALVSIPSLLV